MSDDIENSASDSAHGEVVLEEHSGADEGVSGLELDDFQSKEIRQIFLTTLPEYLEPVAEMIEQALSGGDAARQVHKPLDTTLSSVALAATRVGISDVAAILERMRACAKDIDPEQPASAAARASLFADLAALRRIAGGGDAHAEPVRTGASRTIVAALKEIGGFDASVLERLTAAGVVTVDQLLMAELSEVTAVSGLSKDVARELIARLRGHDTSAGSAAEPSEPAPVTSDTPAPSPPSHSPEIEEGELVRRLQQQVESEVLLDETRVEVIRLRSRVSRLRRELVRAEQRRNDLRSEVQRSRDRLAQRLLELSTSRVKFVKTSGDTLVRQRALEAAESRCEEFKLKRDAVAAEHLRASGEMAELVHRVQRMLRAVAEPEQGPSDRSHGGSAPSPRRLG